MGVSLVAIDQLCMTLKEKKIPPQPLDGCFHTLATKR